MYSRTVIIHSDTDFNTIEPEADNSNASEQATSLKWKDISPIVITLAPVQPLNPDLIPLPIRDWLFDISNRMKSPLEFVATTGVVMLSSLIGTRLTMKPKERDDWTIVPNLWGGVIGDPSTLKTPSISEVLKPLYRIITESQDEFEEKLKQYEQLKATHEAEKKVYQAQEQDRLKGKAVNNPISYPKTPEKPTERRYVTNDATIEKLAELLNENPAGLLQIRDELIGLLAGWDRAGREQDRAFYLEAYNGNGTMSIDRIGRGTLHVKHICLSLFGGIQPAKLLGYLQAATGYDNDGFIQRLQLAVYPDKVKWDYIDEYPNKAARETAYKVIKAITEIDFSEIAYEADEYNQFPYTRFDNEAQLIFKDWLTNWETKVLPNESGLLLEHFTKYRSLMPSLALIFHVVDYAACQNNLQTTGKFLVSKQSAVMAVKWCEYLSTHARRIYGLLDTMHLTAAKELSRHLKNGDLEDGFKARDVYRKGWAHLTSHDQAQSAIDELIDRNWLKEVKSPAKPNGRPEASNYLIHPKIKC